MRNDNNIQNKKIILKIFISLKKDICNIRKIYTLNDCMHLCANRSFQYFCSEAPEATENEGNRMKNNQENAH